MKIRIVDRKYSIGGKWLRFEVMQGVKLVGWKIAIGRYEIRFYYERKRAAKCCRQCGQKAQMLQLQTQDRSV